MSWPCNNIKTMLFVVILIALRICIAIAIALPYVIAIDIDIAIDIVTWGASQARLSCPLGVTSKT